MPIHIPGYQTYRKYRNRKGGGIVVYAAENLKVNRRKDIEHEDLEMVWLEVRHKSSRRALIGVVYRPPNSDTSFMDRFEETILLARSEQKEIDIVGDLNCNMLKSDASTTQLIDILEENGLSQLVTLPTRITNKNENIT